MLTLAFMAATLLPAKTLEQRECAPKVFCISRKRVKHKVEFYVEFESPVEVTITVDFSRFRNMRASVNLPYTATVRRKGKHKLFEIWQARPRGEPDYNYNFSWRWGDARAKHDDKYVYSLPFKPGQKFIVSQAANGTYSHYGDAKHSIDFALPERTTVVAAREGQLIAMRQDGREGGMSEEMAGKENYIRIRHSDGTIAGYYHLDHLGAMLTHGSYVAVGQVIGYSGSTGRSSAPHLHFEVHRPLDGNRRMTIPVKFRALEGEPLSLKAHRFYTSIAIDESPQRPQARPGQIGRLKNLDVPMEASRPAITRKKEKAPSKEERVAPQSKDWKASEPSAFDQDGSFREFQLYE